MTILNDINLEIEDGEIVSILGPSGCGKTTLLNLILGMTDADSGKIIFNEEDVTNVPKWIKTVIRIGKIGIYSVCSFFDYSPIDMVGE